MIHKMMKNDEKTRYMQAFAAVAKIFEVIAVADRLERGGHEDEPQRLQPSIVQHKLSQAGQQEITLLGALVDFVDNDHCKLE